VSARAGSTNGARLTESIVDQHPQLSDAFGAFQPGGSPVVLVMSQQRAGQQEMDGLECLETFP
jgi:hypothetical protein